MVAGAAAEQPRLGFTAHKLVRDMWNALGRSVESQFFSSADWQRARLELWYANGLLNGERPLTAPAWSVVQAGLSELLVSPADKRRAGIALKKAARDVDEDAAVDQIAAYKQRLQVGLVTTAPTRSPAPGHSDRSQRRHRTPVTVMHLSRRCLVVCCTEPSGPAHSCTFADGNAKLCQ